MHPRLRLIALALLLAGAASPPASFTVQVASTSARPEAERLVALLVGHDLPASWSEAAVGGKTVYRVRVGRFGSREEAKAFADAQLPSDLHLSYWVAPLEAATPTPATTSAPQAADASSALSRAIDAQGGAAGGEPVLAKASSVLLRYRLKSVDAKSGEPQFTRQIYLRRGDERRLEIAPIAEDATLPASITIAGAAGAWVTSDGTTRALDPAAARATIESYGPAGMLRLPLAFPSKGAAAAGITGPTKVVGPRTLNGMQVTRVDAVNPPAPYKEASLYLDPATGQLAAVRYLTDAGELIVAFDDYRNLAPGLVVPFKRTVYRDGTVVSTVEIDAFQLGADLDAGLFAKKE